MDPVIIVSGNWIKKNIYVFNADMKNSQSLYSMISDWMNWEQQIEFATTDMYSTNDTPPVYGEQGWRNESEWQSKRDDEKNWV